MLPAANRRPVFFWMTLALTALVLILIAVTGVVIWRHHAAAKDFGWQAAAGGGQWRIASLRPGGPADGTLAPGDVLLSWNGDTRLARIGPDAYRRSATPGERYRLRVRRGETDREAALAVAARPRTDYGAERWLFLLEALAFILISSFGGLLRPELLAARLNVAIGLAFSCDLLAGALRFRPEMLAGVPAGTDFDSWERALLTLLASGFPIFLAFAYHFSYVFTGRPAGIWKALVRPVYAACLLSYVPLTLARYGLYSSGETALAVFSAHPQFWAALPDLHRTGRTLLVAIIGTLMVLVMIPGYRSQTSASERRRLQLVVLAICASVTPITLLSVLTWLNAVTGFRLFSPAALETADHLGPMLLTVIPAAILYAIVKHRVFGVDVVIRRGLQYLLARNFLRALLLLPATLLLFEVVANPDRTLRDILLRDHGTWNLLLCAIAAAALPYRKALVNWLDGRFFREAYDRESILAELIEEVKPLDSVPEISRLTCSRIQAALHPARVSVFYREAEHSELTMGYSSTGSGMQVPADSSLLAELEVRRRSLPVPLSEEISIQQRDTDWLQAMDAALLIPMLNSGNRLVGLLMLGEKKSEEPYTASDRQLLEAIGRQIGILYENLQLREKVTRGQRLERDVLARLDSQINLVKECPTCGLCYDQAASSCERDGAQLTMTLPVERLVEGKYRLDHLLGRGGMGAVYAAHDLRLNRTVAVKAMTGALFGNQSALRRFEVEARASARLNHPHITRVYDYGALGGGGAFLVMEYLEGTGWRDELQRLGVFPPPVAARRLGHVLDGLQAAHHAGIIHRDLKPENLVICGQSPETEIVKILDFGLAKLREGELAETIAMTAPGCVVGTLGYMAPEQLTAGEVDERTDLFTVGLIAAECLTGTKPFPGRTYTEVITAVLATHFTLPGEGEAVRRLERVLQTAMAKDLDRRYRSAAAFREALVPAILACPPFLAPPRRPESADEAATRSIVPRE